MAARDDSGEPPRLPSYRSWGCDDCPHGSEAEPCYGEVIPVDSIECQDGEWWDFYQCEGHAYCHVHGGQFGWTGYRPSPHPEDQLPPPL